MFNPGETIVQQFIIPFPADELSRVVITYKQGNDVILIKKITSGFEPDTESTTKITVSLSQGESLLFKENSRYRIQINVATLDDTRVASKEMIDSTGVQHYDTNVGPHIIDNPHPDISDDYEIATADETQAIIDEYNN